MIGEGEILEQLNHYVSKKITGAFTGKVTNNIEAATKGIVEVSFNEFTYDVRLKSIKDEKEKHFLFIPKKGSMIFCVSEGNSEERFIALAFNELDKIIYKGENMSLLIDDTEKKLEVVIGEISMAMNDQGFVFNEATKKSYLTDINKLVDKVNVIEQSLNGLKNVFKSWMPVPQDGGAKLKADIGSWAGKSITETTINDLKDEKIQH